MQRLARTMPSHADCKLCLDTAESFGAMPNCNDCHKQQEVEILQFVHSVWGAQAICKMGDGRFVTLSITRLKEIKEETK